MIKATRIAGDKCPGLARMSCPEGDQIRLNRWNGFMRSVGRAGYSPQIGVAIAARFYFLDVYCPGCRQVKQVDLRTLDRPPATQLEALIPALSCRDCRPSPPFAQLL